MTLVKVTTMIDLNIKTEFELLSSEHKKNFRDAIELGALNIISEYNPEKASELRIMKLELALTEERQALADYRLIKQLHKSEPKSKKTQDLGLERIRLEKLHEKKEVIITQLKGGSLDWTLMAGIFMFKTAGEARDWMMPKLQEAQV